MKSTAFKADPADTTPGLDAFASETARTFPATQRSAVKGRAGVGALAIAIVAGLTLWGWNLTSASPPAMTGTLRVESDPDGAELQVDGVRRGMAPLDLQLPAGRHTMVVRRGADTRQLPFTIEPGGNAVYHITWVLPAPAPASPWTPAPEPPVQSPATAIPATPIPDPPLAGWMTTASSVPLQVYEGTRLIGTTQSDRIVLRSGAHVLDFVSDPFGFRAQRTVTIAPNTGARVAIELPRVPVSINALPWADVWIDGTRVGQTPIGDLLQSIGVHDVEFRHPQLGTKRATLTVTLNAVARVAVDMRAP